MIGSLPRHRMRAENRIHRATFILVFNSRGELFVQKRSMTKDVYPGYYDIAAGGVVLADESYETSAQRELHEELGISGADLMYCFDFYFEDQDNRVRGRVYTCVYDGDITLQTEEIDSGAFIDPDQCLRMNAVRPLTPDGIYVLKRFLLERSRD